jgi:hypothetical protein
VSSVNFIPVMRILEDLAKSAGVNALVMEEMALAKQTTAEEFNKNLRQIALMSDVANSNEAKQHALCVAFKDTRNEACYGVVADAPVVVIKPAPMVLFNDVTEHIVKMPKRAIFASNNNSVVDKVVETAVIVEIIPEYNAPVSLSNITYMADWRKNMALQA